MSTLNKLIEREREALSAEIESLKYFIAIDCYFTGKSTATQILEICGRLGDLWRVKEEIEAIERRATA